MAGHIVAIGGGSLLDPDSKLESLVLELSGVESPRVCFLATAFADHSERILGFYQAFGTRGCTPTHLELFGRPDRPAARLADQDVIYVSGGNTANALALWRVHGIDVALRSAYERGAVLAGWSAGANCWFEDSVTDSFGPLRALGDGLGFLGGSFCPHYDSELERRPTYQRLVANGMAPGFAADDDAAFVFSGGELEEVVSQRDGARGYRVTEAGEEALEARRPVRRFSIVANASCSGKTTLGRELARRLEVPFVELDALHHGPNWTEATAEELRARVEPLVAEDGWVIDGGYWGKLGDLVLRHADVVVWLDLPVRVWLPRLIRRTLRRVARREELWNGNRESVRNVFFSRDSLIWYALRNHSRHRRDYPERLGPYDLVRLRSPKEVERWLARFG